MPGSRDIVIDVAAVQRGHCAKMQNRQFRRSEMKGGFILKQTQGGILHQMLSFGACFGGELRELRFLLGCELDFHAVKIRG
jgi:hypothetical protein